MSEFENNEQTIMRNKYRIYTNEQMDGFILDGIMHETIREIIRKKNISALYDLIIYTDTNDPDILSDSLNTLDAEDLLWFITNRDVIKTMYPATYTNILSNIFYYLNHNFVSSKNIEPHKIIKAMLGLFDPIAEDYKEVLDIWLTNDTISEVFIHLYGFNPKTVIQSGADRDLFILLEKILLTKINLANGDINKIPCFYTADTQTYLDMLGNYVMPHLSQCDPMIVNAYDAMRQYLVASGDLYQAGIHFRIYFLFANKFHDDDLEIFRKICQIICMFPECVQFTTEYGGLGLFMECCRFDMPDELLLLLAKYQIIPERIHYDTTNYKILGKIFYAATHPVSRPRIHEVLHEAGYYKAYIDWFNSASFEDLRLIDTCQWPLIAFVGDDTTQLANPEIINLKSFDYPALFKQFLALNDLTNTGEIYDYDKPKRLAKILVENKITTEQLDTDALLVSEIKSYLRTTSGIFNPNLVKNKLGQLSALKQNGFISQGCYKCLEQEVFMKYIHSVGKSLDPVIIDYELESLMAEYKPSYTHNYWEALMKSALKVNSDDFENTVRLLITTYPDLTQSKPDPKILIDMLGCDSIYFSKCVQETLIAKFAIILAKFYKDDDINHNDILGQLIQIPISIFEFSKRNYISIITTILIYSSNTNFEFNLETILIEKLISELAGLTLKPFTADVYSNILSVLCIILEKHSDLSSAKLHVVEYLNGLFTNNENMILSDTPELCLINNKLTFDLCKFINDILANTDYLVHITNDSAGVNKVVIQSSNGLANKIKNSRWRNWCASRQIQFGSIELLSVADPNTNEFICPITFEPQNLGDWIINLTGCSHKFSTMGIIEWCRTKNTCPVCRANLGDGILSGANCEMFELV
jgi:hypothetical protein